MPTPRAAPGTLKAGESLLMALPQGPHSPRSSVQQQSFEAAIPCWVCRRELPDVSAGAGGWWQGGAIKQPSSWFPAGEPRREAAFFPECPEQSLSKARGSRHSEARPRGCSWQQSDPSQGRTGEEKLAGWRTLLTTAQTATFRA